MKLATRRRRAQRLARRPCASDAHPTPPPANFIVACGRSGTTILGKLLEAHPEVCYLREPYHIWAEIDRRCDVTNLHYSVDGMLFMDASEHSPAAQLAFNRLVIGARDRCGKPTVVEKTPHNIARIGFLESLACKARYIHIVRNGCDVVRSIDRLATSTPYRIVGRSGYNQWWGEGEKKWHALAHEGPTRGYFPEDVDLLANNQQRGAYEWLVSLGEADRHREALGNRLYEITYSQLTADTRAMLESLCAHLRISAPATWLDQVSPLVSPERKNVGDVIRLPPAMASRFNELQQRFGFEGRTEALA